MTTKLPQQNCMIPFVCRDHQDAFLSDDAPLSCDPHHGTDDYQGNHHHHQGAEHSKFQSPSQPIPILRTRTAYTHPHYKDPVDVWEDDTATRRMYDRIINHLRKTERGGVAIEDEKKEEFDSSPPSSNSSDVDMWRFNFIDTSLCFEEYNGMAHTRGHIPSFTRRTSAGKEVEETTLHVLEEPLEEYDEGIFQLDL